MLSFNSINFLFKRLFTLPRAQLGVGIGVAALTVWYFYGRSPQPLPLPPQHAPSDTLLDLDDNTPTYPFSAALTLRPHAGLHVRMSCLAYAAPQAVKARMNDVSLIEVHDNNEALDKQQKAYSDSLKAQGWRVASYHVGKDNDGRLTGYAGIAFEQPEQGQLVVAHRGTQPNVKGGPQDLLTDLNLVQRQITEHHTGAMAFSLKLYDHYVSQRNYQMGLTGHSLGGFLALLSLYGIERYCGKPPGQHVYAVTLDNPGVKEFFEEINPTIESSHRPELKNLDITNYLSGAVNLVNSCGRHVGTVYAVYDKAFPPLSANPLAYLLNSHDKDRLTRGFNLDTGEPEPGYTFVRMESWPAVKFMPFTQKQGINLVGQEILNNSSWYQRLTHGAKQAMNELSPTISQTQTMTNYATLAYGLADALFVLGASEVDNRAYQHFREAAASTQQLGQLTLQDPYQLNLAALLAGQGHTTQTQNALYTSLSTQWQLALECQGPDTLALWHFPQPYRDFLVRFYADVLSTPLSENPLFKTCFPELPQTSYVYDYLLKKEYVLAKEKTQTADAFRTAFLQEAHTWPNNYLQPGYFLPRLVNFLTQYVLSPSFAKNEDLWRALSALQEQHWNVLKTLRALQTQSRLYLNGHAPEGELTDHRQRHDELRALRDAIYMNQQQLKNRVAVPNDTLEDLQGVLEQLTRQDHLLSLAQDLNLALLSLKQKQPEQVIDHVQAALDQLKNPQFTHERENNPSRFNELYACCYNLLGKAARQTWTRGNQHQTQSVIQAYEKVLTYVPTDAPTLSSLASFYDDLGEYKTAEGYHRQALKLLPIEEGGSNNERKAVTYSNFAWNQYHQALQTDDPFSKQQQLRRARKRLLESLHWAPNAGTYLYLAYVERALIDRGNHDTESGWKKTVECLSKALILEPMNLKVRMERAEAYLELGDCESAFMDAEDIIVGLEDKQHLADHAAYLERAQRVVDACEPKSSYGMK